MSPQHFNAERKRYGFSAALDRFSERRHLPLAGFVALALATGWSFAQERQHSNENRIAVAQSTQRTLYEGCLRGNALRGVLVAILDQQYPQIKAREASGQLTAAEAAAGRKIVKDDIAKVAPVPCSTANKVR